MEIGGFRQVARQVYARYNGWMELRKARKRKTFGGKKKGSGGAGLRCGSVLEDTAWFSSPWRRSSLLAFGRVCCPHFIDISKCFAVESPLPRRPRHRGER